MPKTPPAQQSLLPVHSFPPASAIHCRILDHEDSGMMLNMNLSPDLTAPGGGLGMSGIKHTLKKKAGNE
jgi:hypothetical protein